MIAWLWLAVNAVACAGLAVELSNLAEFPRLEPRTGDERVDVYVAMRDEAGNARAFLDMALALENVERVVVADDDSGDATGRIVNRYAARDARVRYHRTSGGKRSALASAVRAFAPQQRWVLFLDADVRLEPRAVDAIVAYARARNAAAASAWLRVEPASIWSHLFAPLVTLFLLQCLPMRAARGTDPRFAAGNGQCFLVRADAYARSGGHAALSEIVEDVALARSLKRAGYRVALASAASVGSVRGYGSFGANMRGFGRSLYYGAGAAGCVFVAVWQIALALAPVPLYCARVLSARLMGESVGSVLLAPLGAVAGACLAAYALIEGVTGRIAWRGRRISGGETAARP